MPNPANGRYTLARNTLGRLDTRDIGGAAAEDVEWDASGDWFNMLNQIVNTGFSVDLDNVLTLQPGISITNYAFAPGYSAPTGTTLNSSTGVFTQSGTTQVSGLIQFRVTDNNAATYDSPVRPYSFIQAPSLPDTTPPTIPSVSIIDDDGTAKLQIGPSVDPVILGSTTEGMSDYRIYRNGTAYATVSASGTGEQAPFTTVSIGTVTSATQSGTGADITFSNVVTGQAGNQRTSDNITFSYIPFAGDLSFAFTTASFTQGSSNWAKCGMCLRASLDADAVMVMVLMYAGANEINIEWRGTTGSAGSAGIRVPGGIGTQFRGTYDRATALLTVEYSRDSGVSWNSGFALVISMPEVAYAGGFACSNNGTAIAGTLPNMSLAADLPPVLYTLTESGTYSVTARDNKSPTKNESAASAALIHTVPIGDFPTSRNILLWVGSHTSIFNMPIGTAAEYEPLNLVGTVFNRNGLNLEEDLINLDTTGPLTSILWTSGSFDVEFDRCVGSTSIPAGGQGSMATEQVPFSSSFIFSSGAAGEVKRNGVGTLIRSNGRNLYLVYPASRCSAGSYITARTVGTEWNAMYVQGNDLYGAMRSGQQGGSHLSGLAGAIRHFECLPGSGPIRHALRFICTGRELYRATSTPPAYFDPQTEWSANTHWRWPAFNGDSWTLYQGTNIYLRMGSHIAIPANITIASLNLETEPAKVIAQALQYYGAYVCDSSPNTAPNTAFAIAGEVGPQGIWESKFASSSSGWGFSPRQRGWAGAPDSLRQRAGGAGAWIRDWDKIIAVLAVIKNNSPSNPGGPAGSGGFNGRLQPLAPVVTP